MHNNPYKFKKNLFICYTPLQLVITDAIINHLKLNSESVDVIYMAKKSNNTLECLISNFKKKEFNIELLITKYSYPLYFPALYSKFIKENIYETVFLASIDNPLVQFILSIVSFEKLCTFDDGAANIFLESNYYVQKKYSPLHSLIRKLLPIKYDMNDIKKMSAIHYTIYKGFPNIIEETQFLPVIFDENKKNELNQAPSIERAGECNLMVGSIYENEVIGNKSLVLDILKECENFMSLTGLPCYYIKHPRNTLNYDFKKMKIITDPVIAEIAVKNLLLKYKVVNLYGFMSTAQINLCSLDGVVSKLFMIDCIDPNFGKYIVELNKRFNFEVVKLGIRHR